VKNSLKFSILFVNVVLQKFSMYHSIPVIENYPACSLNIKIIINIGNKLVNVVH